MKKIYRLCRYSDLFAPDSECVREWIGWPTFGDFCKAFGVALPPRTNVFKLIDQHGEDLLTLRLIYNGCEKPYKGSYYKLYEI